MSDERPARHSLAQAIRQLASGTLTNDEFEARLPSLTEHAASEMYMFAWCFYDDLYEHRLRGRHRLARSQRRVFARCVLFLRTDLPYEWPRQAKWLWCRQRMKSEPVASVPWWRPDVSVLSGLPFCRAMTRRMTNAKEAEYDRRLKARTIVDDRIWPFRRRSDYEAALRNPPYLRGACSA